MKQYMPINKEQLEKLPIETQSAILDTLQAYEKVYVEYANGQYTTSTGISITCHYPDDHKFIGIAYWQDHYTREEHKQHIAVMNSYSSPE